jgi:hypothetical protein
MESKERRREKKKGGKKGGRERERKRGVPGQISFQKRDE